MVGQIIKTSTWAHNCGMHVVADFLIEKLQQDDLKTKFSGKAYDELLASFQKVYHQEELTWEQIRKASTKASKFDAQIIWGHALRAMMPAIVKKNSEYKHDLAHSFLAALNLFKEDKLEELQIIYPVILESAFEYFKAEALNPDTSDSKDIFYWNEKGFNDYCIALLSIPEGSESFLWLSKEELTIFCEYFNFEFEFVDHANTVEFDPKKIYFSNPTETHWERKAPAEKVASISAPVSNSRFFQELMINGPSEFLEQSKNVGEIFFSELYLDPKLGLSLTMNSKYEELKKCVISKSKQNLFDYIKNNSVPNQQSNPLLEFAINYFDYDNLIDWINSSEANLLIPLFYEKVLLGSAKYQKEDTFIKLLSKFSEQYNASTCMPALIYAAKYNYTEIAQKILALPDFNKTGLVNDIISYVTPDYFNPINQFDEIGIPAIYYAIKNHNVLLAKALLAQGACLTYDLDEQQLSTLNIKINVSWFEILKINGFELALELENPEMIICLSKHDEDEVYYSNYNQNGNNAAHILAKNGKISLLKQIKNTELNLTGRDSKERNCLHISAEIGDLLGIQFCLRNNVSLHSTDEQGNTALHLAAENGRLGAVKHLVYNLKKYNDNCSTCFEIYDIDQKNLLGFTALNLAYKAGHFKVIDYLKSKGCVDLFQDALDEMTKNIYTPESNFKGLIDKHKEAILLADENKNTILHYVCAKYNTERVRTLIRELILVKANVQGINNEGLTPLHIAAQINNVQAIAELLEQGAFVDFITPTGLSACHFAVMRNNKKAFILLKNKGASLELKAYPKAIEQLPVTYWDTKIAITPINIAKYIKDGEIYSFLTKNKLIPEPVVEYKSVSQWLLTQFENKLMFQNHFMSNTLGKTYDLESTTTYKVCTFGKMAIGPLSELALGFTAFGFEFTKQALLYGYPLVAGKTDVFYYYLKPSFHNYTPAIMSKGFDYLSNATSALVYSPFTIMNAMDLYSNTGKRAAGFAGGILLMNLFEKFRPKNKELQALGLFIGKEVGFGLVNAYHQTSPERKVYRSLTKNSINESLNHSYEIWTSLLGKSMGEKVISTAHYVQELQYSLYENIGDSERKVIDKIDEYLNFKAILSLTSNYFNGNKIEQYVTDNYLISTVNDYLDNFASHRDNLLLKIEEYIDKNVWPDSDYRNLVLSYLTKQKLLLRSQARQEILVKLIDANEANNPEVIKQLESQISFFDKEISDLVNLSKELFELTPKGKISTQYYGLKNDALNSEYQVYYLNSLNDFNTDAIIEKAEEALGKGYTIQEMVLYLEAILDHQGIEIEPSDFTQFKSELKIDNLKSCFGQFYKKQFNNHISNKTTVFHEKFEKDALALKEVEAEFKTHATPEELRVLETGNITEVKIQKFDSITNHRQGMIHESALERAHYSNFIEASVEHDMAERNHIQSKALYEEVKTQTDDDIIRINKTYEQTRQNFNSFEENVDSGQVFKHVNTIIKTGKEGPVDRKQGAQIMVGALVKTGLISYDQANKYKGKFYDSFKHKGAVLEIEVKKVFLEVCDEIYASSKSIITSADKQLADCHIRVEQARKMLEMASNELVTKKAQAYEFEKSTLSKLKTSQQNNFKDYAKNLNDNITKLNAFNDALNEQHLANLTFEGMINKKEELSLLVQSKDSELNLLSNFRLTSQTIHELVNNAFDQGSDETLINNYIINYFVQKGIGSYDQLCLQLWDTLCTAQKASSASTRKDHMRSRLKGQTDVINNQFIPAQKIKLSKDLKVLNLKKANLDNDIISFKTIQDNLLSKSNLAKSQYLEKLPESDRVNFEQTLINNASVQSSILNHTHTRNLFALVGQPQLTLESANYQNHLSDEGQSTLKVSFSITKNLLDYKYRFIPQPNDTIYQQEFNQLANSINTVNQAKAINKAKLSIDRNIAEFVYAESLETGKSVALILNERLNSDILSVKESIAALDTLDLQQSESSIKIIQQVIHKEVQAISIENMGQYEMRPIWSPNVPKHHGKMHRMTNNIKKAYHENQEMVIGGAIIAAVLITCIVAPQLSPAAAKLLAGIKVQVTATGIAAGTAATVAVYEPNSNGQGNTIGEILAPRRYDNERATQQLVKYSERRYAEEQKTTYEKLERINQANFEKERTQTSQATSPHSLPIVAKVPSFDNSVFQGGVFGESHEKLPGPLRPEYLPDNIKDSGNTVFTIPFANKENNQQTNINSGQIGLQAEPKPFILSSREQATSNMINGFQGHTDGKTQVIPNIDPAQPLNFLTGTNKIMHPEVAQGSSSGPQQHPVTQIPLRLPSHEPKEITNNKPTSTNQPTPVIFSKEGKNVSDHKVWSKTHDIILGNTNRDLNLGGPRVPFEITSEWLSSLTPEAAISRIPVAELPGLVWEALGEAGRDLYQGTVSLSQFTNSEMMHFLKGEPLETVQIAALMVQFIGEERTRYALNEDLKTVAIAKKMMADFNNLSKEEKFKAGIKLYVLLVTPPITIVKSAQAVNKVTGTVVAAIKKTQKNLVPEPDVFFKGATNLLKDSKNLSELSKKFKELPKPHELNGVAKTFTQNYSQSTKQPRINKKSTLENKVDNKINPPTRHPGPYAPNRELPVKHGVGIPDSEAYGRSYTQLGTQVSERGGYSYVKAREFGADGKAIRDIEFTDHRRKDHTNPHQHRWIPNETGGTPRRGDFEPLEHDLKKPSLKAFHDKNRKK